MALFAAKHVPFYQAAFRIAGVDPERIRNADDVARLPIISKSDVQRDPAAFLPSGVAQDELAWVMTSGSTGQPMRVCRSLFEERLLQAFRIRAELSLGMRLADRRAAILFLGTSRNPLRQPRPTVLERFGILPRTVIDAEKPHAEILESLRKVRPQVISGYPGRLSAVAREMTDADRALIRPRFVITGAETLSPPARQLIEEGFQTPVYDFYGAHECNLVGWECQRHKGLHLNEGNLIVEVLKDGKPAPIGAQGDVVITTLHSYGMPFLRYRLGDIAVRGADCPCGLPFSMVESLHGRALDLAYLPDGRDVSSIPLAHVLSKRDDWIQQFQMVQFEVGKLRVYLVRRRLPTHDEIDDLIGEFSRDFDLEVRPEFVEALPIQPSGKLPAFVSRLRS